MSLPTPDWLVPLLNALRTLSAWLLMGIAITCAAVLFLPAFGGIAQVSLDAFRQQWGTWVWVGMVSTAVLGVIRAIESSLTSLLAYRREAEVRKSLVLIPQVNPWWYLAKQQDDTYVSQIALRIDTTNRSDRPVRILKVKLVRSRRHGGVLEATVMLPAPGGNLHSAAHPVPPHSTAVASVHIMVRGKLGREGKAISIAVELTDQAGELYRINGIRLSSHNQVPPKSPARERIAMALQRIKNRFVPKVEPPLPTIWAAGAEFDDVGLVLNEEKRNYSANGRRRGGLGSLNVTLQSQPNHGWTAQGVVPNLLWDLQHRPPAIDSPNLARLIRLHAARSDDGKRELEDYLLSHLDRRSIYADVAYFIFMGLHRMGRTVDAVTVAQAQLAGDKVFGYSNLLGVLAALVSREHFDFDPALYRPLTNLLTDDPEPKFQLMEKMTLARLQHMDNDPG